MRIIKEKTLIEYCKLGKYRQAEESVKAWIYEVRFSTWENTEYDKIDAKTVSYETFM